MSTPQLIVPSRLAKGKPNRRKVDLSAITNPWSKIVHLRRSTKQNRYRGKVWRYDGSDPIPEAPGRKVGKPHGTHIDDMVCLRKVILLCRTCQWRFYYKRANYYKDLVFHHTSGRCDGCREWDPRGQAYYPEERLAEPGGMLRPGQVITPR